jgi:hypothetical protein
VQQDRTKLGSHRWVAQEQWSTSGGQCCQTQATYMYSSNTRRPCCDLCAPVTALPPWPALTRWHQSRQVGTSPQALLRGHLVQGVGCHHTRAIVGGQQRVSTRQVEVPAGAHTYTLAGHTSSTHHSLLPPTQPYTLNSLCTTACACAQGCHAGVPRCNSATRPLQLPVFQPVCPTSPGHTPLAVCEAGEGCLGVQLSAPHLLEAQCIPGNQPVVSTCRQGRDGVSRTMIVSRVAKDAEQTCEVRNRERRWVGSRVMCRGCDKLAAGSS